MKVSSPLPGRKHKSVFIDLGNPFLRNYFPIWLKKHIYNIGVIRSKLPQWIEASRERELIRVFESGETPRPIAVVFDIDEVLLCNISLSHYSSGNVDFYISDFFADPRTGKKWGRNSIMDPVFPGAVGLVEDVARLGAQPIFVTGRLESVRDETVKNFVEVGLAGPGALLTVEELAQDRGILRMLPHPLPNDTPMREFKENQRKEIEKKYRIALNIGDQISDLGLFGDIQYYLPHPFYYTL